MENLFWYGWVGINIQYFLPLAALFVVGLFCAVREARHRSGLPELLAGLVVGYLGATFLLGIRDPRYTLPLIVFIAVTSTGWIVTTKLAWARALGATVFAVAVAANVVAAMVGSSEVKLNPRDDGDLAQAGAVTMLDDRGYVVGAPRPDPLWQGLLDAARDDGVETAQIQVRESPLWGSDELAFDVAAQDRGIVTGSFADRPPDRPDLRVNSWYLPDSYWVDDRGLPRPCGRIGEGTNAPLGSDSVGVAVSVERLGPDGYERWCDF